MISIESKFFGLSSGGIQNPVIILGTQLIIRDGRKLEAKVFFCYASPASVCEIQ